MCKEVDCRCRALWCEGCGEQVVCRRGIRYVAIHPYPHTYWYCSADCVTMRIGYLEGYIESGQVPNTEQVMHKISALRMLIKNVKEHPDVKEFNEDTKSSLHSGCKYMGDGVESKA